MSQRMTTTKAFLLTSTVIPALALLTLPGYAAQSGILLAQQQQQQEPAEKSDRPERKRPDGAPGAPTPKGGVRPPQAAPEGAPKLSTSDPRQMQLL